jgi:hypothetical protein
MQYNVTCNMVLLYEQRLGTARDVRPCMQALAQMAGPVELDIEQPMPSSKACGVDFQQHGKIVSNWVKIRVRIRVHT